MKKLLLTFISILVTFIGFSQNVQFSENIGTVSTPSTTSITNNTFQNSSLTFGGTADTRMTTPSTGYVGASGNRNVFLTSTVGTNFQISSISTINKFNFTLSFGAFKSTRESNMSELVLEFSTDGINYTSITFPSQPTGNLTATWRLISNIQLPSSVNNISNLRLRWRQTSTSTQFRIDDIKLTYDTSLPVELISFEGYSTKEGNLLIWKTASEYNSDYYVIESSVNGEKYTPVDKVVAAGNSNEVLEYSLLDKNYGSNIIYYRLVQYDFNGENKIYGPISVDNTIKKKKVVKITNMMGQEVNEFVSGGIYLEVYEDGSINRIYK